MTTTYDFADAARPTNRMDPAVKADLCARLRSGRYQQGTMNLRYVGDDGIERWCCLGVATDVVVAPDEWIKQERPTVTVYVASGGTAFPSDDVIRRLGLEPNGPDEDALWALGSANDDGATFAAIADHIDEVF